MKSRQPITATINNAEAGLNFLNAEPPDLEEVRQALGDIVSSGKRAGDVIDRIRALIKKAPPRKESLEINETVLEVIALTRAEVLKNGVSVRTQLAEGLPHVHGAGPAGTGTGATRLLMRLKQCAMAAKRIGNCLSAPVTNRMAFASRCEIQGRASRRHLLSACSKLSTARNRAVWDLGCRSAGRLLKRITDDYGRALICHVALSSASLRLLIRRPHREWSLASTSASSSFPKRCWQLGLIVSDLR